MADVAQEREQLRQAIAGLFAYMDRRGIKRNWLARELRVSKPTVSRYEYGDVVTPVKLERFLFAACKALEVLPERFGYVRPKATQRRAS